MEIKAIETVVEDERGSITQVISSGIWKQLNILVRKEGSLGGGHYHRKTREFFYVLSGEVAVKVIPINSGETQTHTFNEGDCFIILPEEQHYMKFQKETVLIVLYSLPFDPESDDTFVDNNLSDLAYMFNQGNTL